jgi:hypothetical protein
LIVLLLVLIIPEEKIFYTAGTATRPYVAKDFFTAQYGNLINNPLGIGFVIMTIFVIVLLSISIILRNISQQKTTNYSPC